MPSSIYKYYPRKDGRLACIVCDYPYDMDAPLSTLKKHLRAKHNFSIRRPLTKQQLERAREEASRYLPLSPSPPVRRVNIQFLLNPPTATLEERIAKWALQEEIPIDKVAQDSFISLFHPLTISTQLLRSYYHELLIKDRLT
ncbi:hypothetical protein DSO57_1027554 [Entomophthora muscae]|uniref:Uncharacterized protein n=1 Tax=Entomophthora muscae TaxID=34485 RepID=A0ACC2TPZ6_9FUNG|nr:hypothetical protein DSO57_1027554 [Entomophthora muscae]